MTATQENPFLKAIDIYRERTGWMCIAIACKRAEPEIEKWVDPLRAAVAELSGEPAYNLHSIFHWHDEDQRTEEDVILALKHAAEAWATSQTRQEGGSDHG